jgi:hypothetical protein
MKTTAASTSQNLAVAPEVSGSAATSPATLTSVEIGELYTGLVDAFDHVVMPSALSKDNSLRGRLILRTKRKFVLRAAERCILNTTCTTIETIADVMLNEAFRLGFDVV